MNKITLLTVLFGFFAVPTLFCQLGYSANDTIPEYQGRFRYGANMGAYFPWLDQNLADIAAGNPELNVQGVGVDALRPLLSEWFLDYWGYDIRVDAFNHYKKLGIEDNVVFVGYPSEEHRDQTKYCSSGPSELFANMYLPIWDNGENGTPVNDSNYYAVYLYKMVSTYTDHVKFWEIWNEPDFDFVGNSSKQPGEEGNWWEHNPDPCHYALHAPVQHYIRLLRVSYEVIKSISPDDYVTLGGIGYPSFLDVVLRTTDNPLDGSVDSLHPLKGGAYFDVVSYHSYPHIDNSLRAWDDEIFGFRYFRHSDRCVDGMLARQAQMRSVLEKYGYDGEQFPEKQWIITESNIPAKAFDEFIGSDEAQRNYIMKALVASQMNDIHQFHIYQLSDIETRKKAKNEFALMGLYASIDSITPYNQRVNPVGIAYKTTADLLRNKKFNAEQTANLDLPPGVKGAAFQDAEGKFTYMIWAATKEDRTEKTTATYSFPNSFGLKNLNMRRWDYTHLGITTLVGASDIELTGTPVFFTDSRDEVPDNEVKRIFLDCNPNPFRDDLSVKLSLPQPMISSLSMFDMKGALVKTYFTNEKLVKGEHSLLLDGSNLPAGSYILRFEAVGGRRVTCKLVKV